MGAVLLSATPLVLSLRLPTTSRHSLTPALASPVSWEVIPLFHLVKGVFEPSDRESLSQLRHQQTNRVAPVQPLLGCSFSHDRRTWFVYREIVQVSAASYLAVCSKRSNRFRHILVSSRSLSPPFLSLFSLSQILSHQPSCLAVMQRCWNVIVALSRILVFPQISHRRTSSSTTIQ